MANLLLERGLLSPSAIVEGDLEIHDVSRRNRNFRVVSRAGPSFHVKYPAEPDGWRAVAREAAFYEGIGGPHASRLRRHLPAFRGYFPERATLVLELLDARSLAEHHSRGRFSGAVARALGRALADVHATPADGIPAERPYGLVAHHPAVSWLRDMSAAGIELVKLVQGAPALCDRLDEMASEWRDECLVHGDVKSDNCLVTRDHAGRGTGVRLIDWENAGAGDPAWDTRSVLGDYLSSWLSSIPITGDSIDRLAELARFPLARMRPAMRAFWESYAGSRALGASSADRMLLRATRYAGVRLFQSAIEQSRFAPELTGVTLCSAQVAANVLASPAEAAVRLLGLPLGRSRM